MLICGTDFYKLKGKTFGRNKSSTATLHVATKGEGEMVLEHAVLPTCTAGLGLVGEQGWCPQAATTVAAQNKQNTL